MAPPIVTATLQATFLSTLSNVFAQLMQRYRNDLTLTLSLPELSRFVLLTLLTAPINFHWQALLERTFPARPVPAEHAASLDRAERGLQSEKLHEDSEKHEKYAATTGRDLAPFSWRNTILKWFTDCITLGALFNTVLFLVGMGAMKGKSVEQIIASVRKDTFPLIFASYKLWPVASIISFTFIPVEKRIVFLSMVGLCWGVYMSLIASAL